MMISRLLRLIVACSACLCVLNHPADAELADIFKKQLAGLELEPVGDVLANTLATTYPVASASSRASSTSTPRYRTVLSIFV